MGKRHSVTKELNGICGDLNEASYRIGEAIIAGSRARRITSLELARSQAREATRSLNIVRDQIDPFGIECEGRKLEVKSITPTPSAFVRELQSLSILPICEAVDATAAQADAGTNALFRHMLGQTVAAGARFGVLDQSIQGALHAVRLGAALGGFSQLDASALRMRSQQASTGMQSVTFCWDIIKLLLDEVAVLRAGGQTTLADFRICQER